MVIEMESILISIVIIFQVVIFYKLISIKHDDDVDVKPLITEEVLPTINFDFLHSEAEKYEQEHCALIIGDSIQFAIDRGSNFVKIHCYPSLVNIYEEVLNKTLEQYDGEVSHNVEGNYLILKWCQGQIAQQTQKQRAKLHSNLMECIDKKLYQARKNGRCYLFIEGLKDECNYSEVNHFGQYLKIDSLFTKEYITDICKQKGLNVEVCRKLHTNDSDELLIYW